MTDRLKQLSDAGVSIWLDDLSRERIETGNLAELVRDQHVVGVTTNPSIFQAALSHGERYDAQIRELAGLGTDRDQAVRVITTDDVRNACDIMRPAYDASGHVDGRVSIEVSPGLAHDTEQTVAEAADLWKTVDQPNLLIKIPGTPEGWPAITETIADGISVNVTLIFGLDQYAPRDGGLRLRPGEGQGERPRPLRDPLGRVVLRLARRHRDRQPPRRLGGRMRPSRAGPASPTRAWRSRPSRSSSPVTAGPRSRPPGANKQRPLWASTGVKNPDYKDTMYVDDLVVEDTVNTMPEKTMQAVADHSEIKGDQVRPFYDDAAATMTALADAGIDYDDVIEVLIKEGVEKFIKAWDELLESTTEALEAAQKAGR